MTIAQMKARRIPVFAAFVLVFSALAAASGPAAAAGDVLRAVVGLKASVPADARTARFLGTEREGSGVVIDDDGLILTIGYLILESDGAIITVAGGRQVPAVFVAYDHDSGFGLLRATQSLGVEPMRLGKSSALSTSDQVLVVSRGGSSSVTAARVVSRRDFVGYWEYMLDRAIFTSPPHRFHSGAALVGEDGRLLGIGSLFVNNAIKRNPPVPGNMFVPVDKLKPILADLLEGGRRAGPKRPWIGVNTSEIAGRVIVNRVSPGGPAAQAGIGAGDFILGVDGQAVSGQADFYRKLWSAGVAGDRIPLNVLPRGENSLTIGRVVVPSADRYQWLKLNRGGL